MEDNHDNELNTSKFKKKNVSQSVIISQQIKNIRDNGAIMIESKKLTKNNAIIVNGINYVGDAGYLYKIVNYQKIGDGLKFKNKTHDMGDIRLHEREKGNDIG